ncbi:Lsr2 family DNA-binding protein [Gordonia sihwensis]|uniref:Lsr2 family DNA-binding protein n=1 Tax=Gordonia sihwensis TaxID=173559 RepID=UPI003D985CB2
MATRPVMQPFDDLTGEPVDSVEAVHWTWAGVPRVFDAGPETLERLKVGNVTLFDLLRASRVDESATRPIPRHVIRRNNLQIRKWARENGFEVSDIGRISQEILDAYEDAHSDD